MTKDHTLNPNAWFVGFALSGVSCSVTDDNTVYFIKIDTIGNCYAAGMPTANSFTLNVWWQHAVVTWDGSAGQSGVHIYKNGVEVSYLIPTVSGSISSETLGLHIGNRRDGTRPFKGSLDDVRLYNRVLSADEIKRLYNMGR